ncbi:hypothetical protein VNO80_12164 [Phaseolus coccineus]|uniref:Uncharacterized protein n=1 Tax=Phaseolus coccineus TaxID=3886 RepID=A0AAN9NGI5_PHACN
MKNDVTIMRVIMSLITPSLFPLSFIVPFTSRAFHTNSQSELPLSPSLLLLTFSLSNMLSIVHAHHTLSLSSSLHHPLYGLQFSLSLSLNLHFHLTICVSIYHYSVYIFLFQ